jgi:hypothetical protein
MGNLDKRLGWNIFHLGIRRYRNMDREKEPFIKRLGAGCCSAAGAEPAFPWADNAKVKLRSVFLS